MNNINLTTFVQKIVDAYNVQFNTLQRNMSEDKLPDWEAYKKTVGNIRGIRECHDVLVNEYNTVTNNNTVITKEDVPNTGDATMDVTPVEGQ